MTAKCKRPTQISDAICVTGGIATEIRFHDLRNREIASLASLAKSKTRNLGEIKSGFASLFDFRVTQTASPTALQSSARSARGAA